MSLEPDSELLRQFAGSASASAFEELVRRHLNHVFSAALRRVNGERALAEDVTQTVFADFARKAAKIPADMPPSGWLHRHTGFVASKMIDKDRRRRAREKEAATMETYHDSTVDPEWSATAPLLDAAMDTLPESDRDAIVLRFFEEKDFRSVGEVLGMSDDSAQKKVSRAIDKLRVALGRRGVASTGGALATLLAVNSVTAAPASLATNVAAQSLLGVGAVTSGVGGSLWSAVTGLSNVARFKAGAAVAAIIVVAGLAGKKISEHAEPVPVDPSPWAKQAPVRDAETKNLAAPEPPSEPVNPFKRSLEELIAAAAAEWSAGRDSVSGNAKALGFVTQVEVAQMPEALALAAELNDEPARVRLSKNLLAHWAEFQPKEALAWVNSETAPGERADLAQGLLMSWVRHNPDAALGLAGKSGSGQFSKVPLDESAVATIFRTMASDDPRRALARLQMLDQARRAPALRGILDTVQTDAEREKITTLIAEIRHDQTRIQARRAMVEQWARRDPLAAVAFVEKSEPAWERTRLMDSVGFTWLQTDAPQAAAWWVQQVPGSDTLVKIVNVWAQLDPHAAGEWLGQQPAGPGSDTARMTFSRQVADLDPESALSWAETVSDTKMREDTIDRIFTSWHVRNADAANAFLSNAGWPAERVERLSR